MQRPAKSYDARERNDFAKTGEPHAGFLLRQGQRGSLRKLDTGRPRLALCAGGQIPASQWGYLPYDGKWYYFSTEAGSSNGMLLKNTATPDGFRVDENGVWVQ